MTERVTFTPVDSPSLQEARNLDANGKWLNAANHFFTLAELETNPDKQARYKIGGIQMLINLGDLDQANEMLDNITPDDSEIEALIYEKRAWIADYKGAFEEELRLLQRAKELTSDNAVLSTITHFTGRAHMGLAAQGQNSQYNIGMARRLFERHLKTDMRENNPVGVAFAMLWIARCDLFDSNLSDAKKRLPVIQSGFRSHKELNPDSGIESHYHLIKGNIDLASGNIETAREEYHQALDIQLQTEKHPRSTALAYLGIAQSYQREGNTDMSEASKKLAAQASETVFSNPYF